MTDWPSFHQECKLAFGFPDFYGRNLSALIDCLSTLREDDAMSAFHLGPDEYLRIELMHGEDLRVRAPDILDGLAEAAAEVNERYLAHGEPMALVLELN
jgi:RNAse (barnase) inhibitor barstar